MDNTNTSDIINSKVILSITLPRLTTASNSMKFEMKLDLNLEEEYRLIFTAKQAYTRLELTINLFGNKRLTSKNPLQTDWFQAFK